MSVTSVFFASHTLSRSNYNLGDVEFTLIELPGQEEFWMGSDEGEEDSYSSERPKHRRRIHPFTLAEYPVTQALWGAVCEQATERGLDFDKNLLRPKPSYFLGGQRPVEQVSWHDAQEFCRVLNELLGKPAGYFRLPTEAEWEYAARSGNRNYLHSGSNELSEVGWSDNNNDEETIPVGLLAPNAFGLYDMSGNVWEWCADDWHSDYNGHPSDSSAWIDSPTRAARRVRRGGSWFYFPRGCRSASRYRVRPDYRFGNVGFRLAAPSSDPASW